MLSLTLVNEEVGEILSHSGSFASMWNVLAGLPLVDVLLRMELHAVKRVVPVLHRRDELLTEFVVIERHHAKFIGQVDTAQTLRCTTQLFIDTLYN